MLAAGKHAIKKMQAQGITINQHSEVFSIAKDWAIQISSQTVPISSTLLDEARRYFKKAVF